MTIYYMQGERLIASTNNANVVPRIGDKVKVFGEILKVKDVTWCLDNQMWVVVQIGY